MTVLKKSTVYTATDGSNHASHKAAVARQNVIDRAARVTQLLNSKGLDADKAMDANEIAAMGPELLEALTLPSRRAKKAA